MYRESKKHSLKLKNIAISSHNTQYVVDTNILTNPNSILNSIYKNIDRNNSKSKFAQYILHSTYGQLKVLNQMGDNELLLITPEIYKEYKEGHLLIRGNSGRLIRKLRDSNNVENSDTLIEIVRNIRKLNKRLKPILKNSIYPYQNLLSSMSNEFKSSSQYVPEIDFKSGFKKISDTDLDLLMLAVAEHNFSENFIETKLVTSDKDILCQGLPIFQNTLLKSPTIVKPFFLGKYGTEFNVAYKEFVQKAPTNQELSKLII